MQKTIHGITQIWATVILTGSKYCSNCILIRGTYMCLSWQTSWGGSLQKWEWEVEEGGKGDQKKNSICQTV